MEEAMDRIEIIEYEDKYHHSFKELSYEWLIKYNLLEPEDELILNNPRGQVLDKGGRIFFAKYKGEIVGTASIIKINENTFELAKLGVTECYQRMGIARKLVKKCIMTSRQESAKKLVLYTNRKLRAAANLYKQLGFVKVDMTENKYVETDTKMELVL